jgi:quercetin dioxygenase-like cupin family protein
VVESFSEEMRAAGGSVSEWANGPGYRYARHAHPYRKVLLCVEGSIVFHLPDRDVPLSPGDRLDLGPGVEHAASVGPSGVRCAEAHLG